MEPKYTKIKFALKCFSVDSKYQIPSNPQPGFGVYACGSTDGTHDFIIMSSFLPIV